MHFEGKTLRTLPDLVLGPGNLTRRYIEGERGKFVSPPALFLFSVFLMFAVFQMIGISMPRMMEMEQSKAEADASGNARVELSGLPAGDTAEWERLEGRITDLNEVLRRINADIISRSKTMKGVAFGKNST